MMYEDLLKKLVGSIVQIWFSGNGEDYVRGRILDVDSEMVKLETLGKNSNFVYVEFLQEIQCVTTTEDVKLED